MSLYTSYETSIALREAGTGQLSEKYWMRPDEGEPYMGPFLAVCPWVARAYRADEIIEVLHARKTVFSIYNPVKDTDKWRVTMFVSGADHADRYKADSLVEALAAAWLAVMREEK